jgi:hypothetical protein
MMVQKIAGKLKACESRGSFEHKRGSERLAPRVAGIARIREIWTKRSDTERSAAKASRNKIRRSQVNLYDM